MVGEGGKAAGLRRLAAAGAVVPPFFVIVADADAETFQEAYNRIGGRVAVRSSALAEDGTAHSFAGQYVTVLGVEGWPAIAAAVFACRESGHGERVLAYCTMHGLLPSPVAVVVQQMIEGDASGVCFTATPEDPDRALLSAGLGLGEGVVQGLVPCDTFRVAADGTVSAELAEKDAAVRLVDGAPTEVAADPREITLTTEQAASLAAQCQCLAVTFGCPLDIEWTRRGSEIYFLQARPITTPIPTGRRLLWDNSNIIESYNGVTTPLTYSFANHAYTIVYQLFLRVMGVEDDVIRANSSIFPRMIGLIRGRVFYNLNAWYRAVQLLPGYSFNRAFMEQMMGVGEVAADEDAGMVEARNWRGLPRLVRLGVTMMWRTRTIDADVAGFHTHFDRTYIDWRNRDLTTMAPEELVDAYEVLERELLWAWSVPITNDFLTMIFYGTLRKLCGTWVGDSGQLHNELLAGEGGLESVAPMHAALTMAEILRGKVSAALTEEEAFAVPGFRAAWDEYIARYGDRCVNELKLETPSLRQDASFLWESLRNYLRAPPVTTGGEQAVRVEAERRAFAPLHGLRRVVFRWVLGMARARVRDRENLRFLRTRIFGLVRDIFRALAVHMVRVGAITHVDDVFYLTVPELLGWVRGTAASLAFKETIMVRRREFDGYRAGEVPSERFHTRGAVHAYNRFFRPAVANTGGLVGTGACPGIVTGPVIVLADPHEGASLNGEILVAFRTDPGWVPLYPAISGLLVERGSLLSHSAVVARELGLPTIIGIKGLTAALKTGDRVRMDGAAGTVEPIP